MNDIRIQASDFSLDVEMARLLEYTETIGAVSTFCGIVRKDDGLNALHLEHYPSMTEREIARHVELAKRKWELSGSIIVHRIGRLVPGDRIVLVMVSAERRLAAMAACEFLMDYLKTEAPFWKQEERRGAFSWVEQKTSDIAAADRWTSR